MSRISEKVRDIVDVRPYTTVDDLFRDPEATLANYHFTDITAYMMARWFDAVGSADPLQRCRAIAGFRGVGKSHFLAAFAILMSHPELRSRLADHHVQTAVQQMLRRHYPVINIRRGSGGSLSEELRIAAAVTFDLKTEKTGDSIKEIVSTVAELSGGLTPIIIIDSSPERIVPIERNDGDDLAQIAEACKAASVFVGIALDDEIAMADGSNAAISKSFNIEYLDPENLHKVVNTHIFPKNPRTQNVLGSLYADFREAIPEFKWSEQRFTSLYPLHPVLLELAPFIRSYLPKFALFGFASSAGEIILGRPADSLIGVDDVFNAVEFDLRKVPELQSLFEAYDAVSTHVSAAIPVAARHKSKLVLKVLLLNTLAQRPSSGADVAAAMMIVDNGDPGNSVRDLDLLLGGFAAAFPKALSADTSDSSRVRYRFNIGSNEFERHLDRLIGSADPLLADRAFAAAVVERYSELADMLSNENGSVTLLTEWRGSRRPVQLCRVHRAGRPDEAVPSRCGWEIKLVLGGSSAEVHRSEMAGTLIKWKTGELNQEERRSLIAHALLPADKELWAKFPESVSSSNLSLSNAVKAAVERVVINEAKLAIDGFDYNFSDAARAAPSLSEMIGQMLEPLFEAVYPEHPYFVEPLTPNTVDRFVRSLSDGENADQSVMTFGVALGIAEFNGSGFTVLQKEELLAVPSVGSILASISETASREVELPSIQSNLAKAPVGLTCEAVHLILTAMAHRGMIELVTAERERIGGRSIDLRLDWSNILAIVSPRNTTASHDDLVRWAKLICSDETIKSVNEPGDRTKILEAFVEIAAQWERRNPFEAFEQISDCELNTDVWRHSNKTWDSYVEMVANINDVLLGNIAIEDSIDGIRDSFQGRVELFERSRVSIVAIEDFVKTNPEINRISNYLSLCDITNDVAVGSAREDLRESLRKAAERTSDQGHREIGYRWEKFYRLYTEYYTGLHSGSAHVKDIRQSAENGFAEGTQFVPDSETKPAQSVRRGRRSFRAIRRKIAALTCPLDPAPFLQAAPFCKCGFKPADSDVFDDLNDKLRQLTAETFG